LHLECGLGEEVRVAVMARKERLDFGAQLAVLAAVLLQERIARRRGLVEQRMEDRFHLLVARGIHGATHSGMRRPFASPTRGGGTCPNERARRCGKVLRAVGAYPWRVTRSGASAGRTQGPVGVRWAGGAGALRAHRTMAHEDGVRRLAVGD